MIMLPPQDRPFRPAAGLTNALAPSAAIAVWATLALAISPASAATLFSDDFSGGGGDLNGSTPDITTGGATWVASTLFNADGTTEQGQGSATLAFTPVDGLIYTLDVSYIGVALGPGATSPENDWFAMGFVNGQNAGSTSNDRFISGNVVGTAWMFTRGDTSQDPNTFAWKGSGQLGAGNGGLAGLSVGVKMPTVTDIDMRVILDTTGGPGTWSATWLAKLPADPSYTVVRPAEGLLAGSTISAVGLARSNTGVDGTVESFSLTSVVPEPSAAALLGLGSLALLRRRRR